MFLSSFTKFQKDLYCVDLKNVIGFGIQVPKISFIEILTSLPSLQTKCQLPWLYQNCFLRLWQQKLSLYSVTTSQHLLFLFLRCSSITLLVLRQIQPLKIWLSDSSDFILLNWFFQVIIDIFLFRKHSIHSNFLWMYCVRG